MIVYADRQERVRTAELIDHISECQDATEALIRYGQLEAGVLDELWQDADGRTDISEELRRIAIETDYRALEHMEFPSQITVRTPEGYAFYGLYPEAYRRAASQFYDSHTPAACTVIGIRSIGTSLSAAAVRVLRERRCSVWSFTVRPRGHPFDREIRLSAALESEIQARGRHGDDFLVVDEGPGLSGSSFSSVAEALNRCGIADDNIIFLPGHKGDPAGFRSEKARARWPRHRRYAALFRPDDYVPADSMDLSGGQWRTLHYRTETEWPACHPQHERLKFCSRQELWKFTGLAHIGREKLSRAVSLAEFTPRTLGFENGFMIAEFVNGRPLTTDDVCDELLDTLANYLATLRANFAVGQEVPYRALVEMIETNSGVPCPPANPVIEQSVVIAGDGRMLPHEWLCTGGRFLKTDALDHHADHFFPGCQDVAWDVAGAAVEFDMTERSQEGLLSRYLRLQRDTTLLERLPFYKLAYLAYRIGYATMAEQSLAGTAEGARFAALRRRYTTALDSASLPMSSRA
jgi:hypothetical protein